MGAEEPPTTTTLLGVICEGCCCWGVTLTTGEGPPATPLGAEGVRDIPVTEMSNQHTVNEVSK